jgi:hypothetical protein
MSGVRVGDEQAVHPLPVVKAGEWLKEHNAEYEGKWVALRDDELVAVAGSFRELRAQLDSLSGLLVTLVT